MHSPKDPQALSLLGDVLAALPPEDGAGHFQGGLLLAEAQSYLAAATQFAIARKTYKDPYPAGYNQTLAYLRAGDYPAALRTANELLNEGHQTAELANLAAAAYLKNGQPREAANALRIAIHLDPKNEDSYVDLCSLALDQNNYDTGLEVASVGLTHLPNSERLYLQRGVLHAMKGQFGEAQEDFTKAAGLTPQDVLPQVAQALVAMQSGSVEKAVGILRQSVQWHPDSYLAQYWLAVALMHGGAEGDAVQEKEVLAALQASVRANPEFWHSQAELGKMLLKQGRTDEAIVHLEKSAALNPAATSPLYLLAQAYRLKGDATRAKQLIAQVSKMQAEEREDISRSVFRSVVPEGAATPLKATGKP